MQKKIVLTPPTSLGYHMPAEWEKHEAIWLAWPHNPEDYPKNLENVHKTYLEIIKTVSNNEKVHILAKDNQVKINIEERLAMGKMEAKNIHIHIFNYADVWMRDYGPIFILNVGENKLAMIHWKFNAWGEKYEELKNDTNAPPFINKFLKIPCFKPGIVLEGGSIDVNGKGTLLTTQQCLLNKNRNPTLSKEEIESYLMDYLGVSNIIWLIEGILGDDTDGHIDDIARFVNPTTVLCAYESNKNDANYFILKNNYEILSQSTDQDGRKLQIIKLPMPGEVFSEDGASRLPASYANFYIGNGCVLVPFYGHENDIKALSIIQDLFPTRKAIGINCSELAHGLGAIHCISQQQPATRG